MKSRVQNTLRPKKILVVDDNHDAAELVSSLLEAQGHEVQTAHTPTEALAVATRQQPDIAFLDIGLPEMDGFELAARMRSLPELRDCRLVAITGYDDAEDRKQSKRIGFEAHLVKPISLDTLEQVIQSAPEFEHARGAR